MDLSYNRITHIDDHAFLPCAALSDLRLSENRLTYMPSTFGPNSPCMSYLSIRHNLSCVIDNTYFRQFRSLQHLSIGNIGMRKFPDDFFTGLISLKTLVISKRKAPNLTKRTVNLDSLYFEDHIGSTFPEENFLNLWNLTKAIMQRGDHMTIVPRFLGATSLTDLWLQFTVDSIPDLSHFTSLSSLVFIPTKLICDHRLCWALFESFSFDLLWLDRPGCFNPQKFRFRSIYAISKLELGCYDSKFVM